MNKLLSLYKKYNEIVNYIIIGGLTTLVSIGVKFALLFTILDAENPFQLQIAIVTSWIAAVIFAFFANKIVVFKSKSKSYVKEFVSFVGGRLITLLLEMSIMALFCNVMGLNSDRWVLIFTLVCQVLVTVLNYFISKLFVFKKQS